MVIGVDFDGTIVRNKWPKIGRLRWLAIPVLRWLSTRHELILYTCRSGELLYEALMFLKSHDIKFHYVNQNTEIRIREYGFDCRKISADLYIDDKAVGYWNWLIVFILVGLSELKKQFCIIIQKNLRNIHDNI